MQRGAVVWWGKERGDEVQRGAVVWRSRERGVRCRGERLFGGVNRGE